MLESELALLHHEQNKDAKTQKLFWHYLRDDLVEHLYPKLFTNALNYFYSKGKCTCGASIKDEKIQGYPHHGSGWDLADGVNWWLFIVCPKCDYAIALSKLGVSKR